MTVSTKIRGYSSEPRNFVCSTGFECLFQILHLIVMGFKHPVAEYVHGLQDVVRLFFSVLKARAFDMFKRLFLTGASMV